MFKKILFGIYAFLCFSKLFSFSNDFYSEWTIENGMEVYVLEDFSSATITVQYAVKAGISSQSPSNTGFFSLYANLFKYGKKKDDEIRDLTFECSADFSKFTIKATPSSIKNTMEQLARHAFAPVWTDQHLSEELSNMKNLVMEYANTPSSFINASIDSRVFSTAPWKHDSGIYPSLFESSNPSKARKILSDISKNWYVPQNSAIFITGCIKKEAALELAKNTFGKYESANSYKTIKSVAAGGKQRKFVLYDSDFSSEITQIVMEYTSLSINESDLLSKKLNFNSSSLKENLINEKILNIRDREYINVSAAHKNGSSRVIIQSLFENNNFSPCEQSEKFISIVKKQSVLNDEENFNSAKEMLIRQLNHIKSSPLEITNYLSMFWAIKDRISFNNDNPLDDNFSINHSNDQNKSDPEYNLTLLDKMLFNKKRIMNLSCDKICEQIKNEEPFVFVMINTKSYNKYQKDFKNAGYSAVNRKNGSWYTQKLFENASKNVKEDKNYILESDSDSDSALRNFISESRKNLSNFKLSNGIPVIVKNNDSTENVLIMIKIDGGKLKDDGNPGFQSVMTNAFASNIQDELNSFHSQGLLESDPEVFAQTELSASYISIECNKDDTEICFNAICNALIFGEIAPAKADSYVYSVQTEKRLWNASPVNQLTDRAVQYFYDTQDYREAFDTEKDILENITYADIIEAYPYFLNSTLYSIGIVGHVKEIALKEQIENSLGLLKNPEKQNKSKKIITNNKKMPDFSKTKTIFTPLKHLFYTDISAKDAGPMPAVLIPTTNFSDPVQYWYPSPNYKNTKENHYESVILNAVMYRFKEFMEETNDGSFKEVKISCASTDFPATSLTFLNVDHYLSLEKFYEKARQQFLKNLSTEKTKILESKKIKNSWILNNLDKSATNRGTGFLIFKNNSEKQSYLDDYEKILDSTAEDFLRAAENALKKDIPLKLYSQDAKK